MIHLTRIAFMCVGGGGGQRETVSDVSVSYFVNLLRYKLFVDYG